MRAATAADYDATRAGKRTLARVRRRSCISTESQREAHTLNLHYT